MDHVYSIDIPINNRPTLNQHLINISIDTLLTIDQQSVDSRLSVNQLIYINQKLVDSWPTVDRDVECWSMVDQVPIKGIDQHSTMGAFSTHVWSQKIMNTNLYFYHIHVCNQVYM